MVCVMEALDLIGRLGCDRLRAFLDKDSDEFGTARFVLHRLGVAEAAAIATAVSKDPDLMDRVEILLPRYKMAGIAGISEDWLTDKSTTEVRTTACTKEARLFALFDVSQEQSLAQVEKINKDILLAPELAETWVREAIHGMALLLTDSMKHQWASAVKGIFQIDRLSLRDAAQYLCSVRDLIQEGQTVRKALGKSLWVLRLPSFKNAFEAIPEPKLGQPSEWRRKLSTHWANQCYLVKRNKQQIPYTRQSLDDAFEKIRDLLQEPLKAAIRAFIDGGDGWTTHSDTLSRFDWEEVRPFFEGAGKAETLTLGTRTKKHFGLLDPDTILPADWAYIDGLIERGAKPVKNEEDEQFYFSHPVEIQQDPPLAASWERFVFGTEAVCSDFHLGLLECVRRLMPARQEIKGQVIVQVTAEESEKIRFKLKNESACRYFQARYCGLQSALASHVEFRKVLAFDYDNVHKELEDSKGFKPESTAKTAMQLSFRIVLKSVDDDSQHTSALRLTWIFPSDSVLGGYSQDLARLHEYQAKHNRSPLIRGQGRREERNAHSTAPALSLSDVSGFAPGRSERGAFVPAVSKCEALGKEWDAAVKLSLRKSYISPEFADDLAKQFTAFEGYYATAVDSLQTGNFTAPEIHQQAVIYGNLLESVSTRISADEARRLLLRPVLQIGVASVSGAASCDPVAVVCPWHPMRMYLTSAKVKRFQNMIVTLLDETSPSFTDGAGELFFKEAAEMLIDPGSPEVVLDWRAAEPAVLAMTDSLHEYSLHESPIATTSSADGTNEDPHKTAEIVADVVDSYLTLQPHERDSFSIVLFNCDSASLPQAVVESVRAAGENKEQDAMCQVILAHTDRRRLRQLYQRIASQDGEDEAFHVSESSRDFMARVRINIMVDEAPEPDPRAGPPADIVFCHDVISRHADLTWARANRAAATFPVDVLQPHQWSRRREMQRGDRESVVYLACPAQTDEGWRYYLALTLLCEPEFALESWKAGQCQLPARRLNFDKAETNHVFRQTHALGNWVVNLDELLDRRLLRDRNIKVIRYRQTATQGRALIISSNASDALLRATIQNKLHPLLPDGSAHEVLATASESFVEKANEISGQLVLRAARRGTSTNELLGLVLSAYLVRKELGKGRDFACFLLDDYATWLGQTEDRIADLLILSPMISDKGEKMLDIIVTEAKFIQAGLVAAKARESSKQLRDSLRRLETALFGNPPPADQDIWLARISDLLVDGLHDSKGALAIDLPAWRSAIRRREFKVCLRGYSHVFIHGPADQDTEGDKYVRVPGTLDGHQECFSRSSVRSLLRALLNPRQDREDPTALRISLAGHNFTARSYLPVTPVGMSPGPAPDSPTPPPGPIPPPGPTSPPSSTSKEFVPAASEPPASTGPVESTLPPPPIASALAKASLPATGFNAAILRYLDEHHSPAAADADAVKWLDDTSRRARVALQKRGMTAKLLEHRLTPNAALLKFQGTDDLTIAKVESKISELRTTDGLDIISVRAELGRIAVSIARPHREILYLHDVWRRWKPDTTGGNTKLVIGVKEDDNELLFLSPDPQPHSLVAGWTGSGKSVLMQNIILGIAATNTPDQSQIVLIDPKQAVDYFAFEALPHFVGEPITKPDEALRQLHGLVAEMKRRYEVLREARVPNVTQYAKKIGKVMPRLWVIHDEFAVWMQEETYRDEVTSLVNQLSVEARASGIYLVFAAQRPDVTVLPMQLRSNLGNRLVLRVDTEATSEISLGIRKGGAERLLGNGHLAALCGGASSPVYAQVPFISEDDLTGLVTAIRNLYRS
jgi:S-DNA-T family DNA segregation ATPase FtsK/SpoIIIE